MFLLIFCFPLFRFPSIDFGNGIIILSIHVISFYTLSYQTYSAPLAKLFFTIVAFTITFNIMEITFDIDKILDLYLHFYKWNRLLSKHKANYYQNLTWLNGLKCTKPNSHHHLSHLYTLTTTIIVSNQFVIRLFGWSLLRFEIPQENLEQWILQRYHKHLMLILLLVKKQDSALHSVERPLTSTTPVISPNLSHIGSVVPFPQDRLPHRLYKL